MSQTLNFDLPYYGQTFEIEFESESRERNLLMEVKYQGFHLDSVELRHTHPEIYKAIESAMKNNADTFWSDNTPFDERLRDEMESMLLDENSFFETINKITRTHAKINYGLTL